MPRETALQRNKRLVKERDRAIETYIRTLDAERAEIRRLSARCEYLYEVGLKMGTELARARLAGGESVPNYAHMTTTTMTTTASSGRLINGAY